MLSKRCHSKHQSENKKVQKTHHKRVATSLDPFTSFRRTLLLICVREGPHNGHDKESPTSGGPGQKYKGPKLNSAQPIKYRITSLCVKEKWRNSRF